MLSAFLSSFGIALLSEIADKTQLVILGLAVTITATVFFGARLAERLPRKIVKITIGALFIIFGAVSLLLRTV